MLVTAGFIVLLLLGLLAAGLFEETDQLADDQRRVVQTGPDTDSPSAAEEDVGESESLNQADREAIAEAVMETRELYREAEPEAIREHLTFVYRHIMPEAADLFSNQSDAEIRAAADLYLKHTEDLSPKKLLQDETGWRPGGEMVEVSFQTPAGEEVAVFAVRIDGRWYGV